MVLQEIALRLAPRLRTGIGWVRRVLVGGGDDVGGGDAVVVVVVGEYEREH